MSYGELKSTWSSVELNLLLCAFILVKSGCFTDRETLQLVGISKVISGTFTWKNTLKATPTERLSYKFSISTLCDINSQQSSFVPRAGSKITIGPCVSFKWQMVKTRVIRLHGVEERNVRDQIALGTFLSLRMLATYMRRMRNYNLEIRIAGSSCRPQ